MRITHLERTVVRVPFLPGILPPPEYEEFTESYPAPLGERRQDVLRIHTDEGITGLGMSGPYFGDHEHPVPDLIGRNPLDFRAAQPGGRRIRHCPAGPDRQGDRLAPVSHLRREVSRPRARRLLDRADGTGSVSRRRQTGVRRGLPRHQSQVLPGRWRRGRPGARHTRGRALTAHRPRSRSPLSHCRPSPGPGTRNRSV